MQMLNASLTRGDCVLRQKLYPTKSKAHTFQNKFVPLPFLFQTWGDFGFHSPNPSREPRENPYLTAVAYKETNYSDGKE